MLTLVLMATAVALFMLVPQLVATKAIGWSTIYGADREHDTPYMTRVWLGRLRLHIFHRGDQDPDPHDHPWAFWTFPLTTYIEEVATETPGRDPAGWFVREQVVRAMRVHYRSALHTHRVLYRAARPKGTTVDNHWRQVPGRIVTIVWVGPTERHNAWGFLKLRDGRWCWQDWREYLFEGGKHAPCEE